MKKILGYITIIVLIYVGLKIYGISYLSKTDYYSMKIMTAYLESFHKSITSTEEGHNWYQNSICKKVDIDLSLCEKPQSDHGAKSYLSTLINHSKDIMVYYDKKLQRENGHIYRYKLLPFYNKKEYISYIIKFKDALYNAIGPSSRDFQLYQFLEQLEKPISDDLFFNKLEKSLKSSFGKHKINLLANELFKYVETIPNILGCEQYNNNMCQYSDGTCLNNQRLSKNLCIFIDGIKEGEGGRSEFLVGESWIKLFSIYSIINGEGGCDSNLKVSKDSSYCINIAHITEEIHKILGKYGYKDITSFSDDYFVYKETIKASELGITVDDLWDRLKVFYS